MFDGEEYVFIPKKRLTRAFKTLVSRISEAIYRYDPIGVRVLGAPKDEYEGEAYKIAARLRQAESETYVTKIMVDVIGEAFDIQMDSQATALEGAVHEIWEAWQAYLAETEG